MIATGGHPSLPAINGAELGITSDGFFELERLPPRVAVVGSGYVAAELGGVLRALGSEVTRVRAFDGVFRVTSTRCSARAPRATRCGRPASRSCTRAVPGARRRADAGLSCITADGRRRFGTVRLPCCGRSAATAEHARARVSQPPASTSTPAASSRRRRLPEHQRRARLRARRRDGPRGAHAGRDRRRAAARGPRSSAA